MGLPLSLLPYYLSWCLGVFVQINLVQINRTRRAFGVGTYVMPPPAIFLGGNSTYAKCAKGSCPLRKYARRPTDLSFSDSLSFGDTKSNVLQHLSNKST